MANDYNYYDLALAGGDPALVAQHGAEASKWPEGAVQLAICRVRNIPLVELEVSHVDQGAFDELAQLCRRYKVLPTYSKGMVLVLAMLRPWDEAILVRLRQTTHQEIRTIGIRSVVFERLLARLNAMQLKRLDEKKKADAGRVVRVVERPVSWNLRDRPMRKVVDEIIRLAADLSASDIILTPGPDWLDIRIKASGKTEVLPPCEQSFAQPLLRAFKETAGMSVRETRAIQNGKADVDIPGHGEYELRLATSPTVFGESLVARLQNRREQLERMQKLPFVGKNLEIVQAALLQKQGMFITTGPVNSGKTTLMYSCLRQIDPSTHNIRTLEDPPEINLPWVGQIPVDDRTDVNFSAGLKSLLRQSPDVILVGEIRSPEVCQTAIEAVLTGHLIFCSIHATDALGVVPRLLDLGVSGHKIAASLLIVIGQRLVPALCPSCRAKTGVTPEMGRHFGVHGLPVPEFAFEPVGCPKCDNTGYRGRVPLFEMVCPNDAMRETISDASNEHFARSRLYKEWNEAGGAPLGRHALLRVASGEIDYPEAQKHDPVAFQRMVSAL